MKFVSLALTCLLVLLAACASQKPLPEHLDDSDVIPPGSRLNFWVFHDDDGWKESDIFVGNLPRQMTGQEARLWAEGVGNRDGGQNWTKYYVVVTLPGAQAKQLRSPVFIQRASPHEIAPVPRYY